MSYIIFYITSKKVWSKNVGNSCYQKENEIINVKTQGGREY